MSKSTTRRKKDAKSKNVSEKALQAEEATTSSIAKYFLKQPDSNEVECPGNNVSVPCPDDAALPSSTYITYVASQTAESSTHNEIDDAKTNQIIQAVSSNEASTKSSVLVNKVHCNQVIVKKKTRKPTLVTKNSQITDFFPVRRSNRKTSISKMNEKNKIIEDTILSGKEEGLKIKIYPDKGRGVITTRTFKRGEFVLEYFGELIDCEEAKRREDIYSDKENVGCYMYYFRFQNKQYCIDATKETNRLGRLVNHSKKGNLKTRTFFIQESPHLVFFADRDILPGEELSYDYGDRRKSALESHPWLAS